MDNHLALLHNPGDRLQCPRRLICNSGTGFHLLDGILDQFRRLGRRRGALCRKTPHFLRHDRKAFARLPGARSLHRRIQSQNIGLKRDIVDHFDNLCNALGRTVDILHRRHHVLHLNISLFYIINCLIDQLRRGICLLCVLFCLLRDLIDRRCDLLDRARLLRGSLCQGLARTRHL